ncbi:hypothetical protein ACFWP2_10865 [Kitasatospora sp. NPDC058444]|uniref:hypothetical protein n=1 Tax=Kitasatospora sp. NPDC058444 TaxID=3346504 RepID=UPI0036664F2C
MNASVIARIAKIVPLAVGVAVGVAACGPTNGGASVAASAPSATPAVTSSATPGAGAVPTTEAAGTAGTATKPAPPKAPAQSGGSGIGITFGGLSEGGKIELNDLVPFTVTWKNNDATGSRGVAPVVSTQQYEGAPCTMVLATAEGTLERKDASGWKKLDHLSQGGGMDYAGTGNDAAFTLAAGQSRTIEYRMRLSTANRPGRITIEADAPVPNSKDYRDMVKAELNAAVVDRHSPEMISVMPPAKGVITTDPLPFGFRVSSPDGTTGLHPRVAVWSSEGLTPNDVTLEARVGEEWKPVELREDCGLVAIAPDVAGVRDGNTVEYTFRVTFKQAPKNGGDVDVRVGAESNGHRSVERSVFLRDAR